MGFIFKKIKMVLPLLLVAAYVWGQATDAKNFTITPQTVIRTNLPKLSPCLFELQDILRERFGQIAIVGGMRATGNSVIELWTDVELEGEAIIYSIYRQKNSPSEELHKNLFNAD